MISLDQSIPYQRAPTSYPGYIPEQAFRFFPSANDQKTPDGIRRIFEGGYVTYDNQETRAIAEFKNYCQRNNYQLSPVWKDHKILRFLQANQMKPEKTLNAVKQHDSWRASKLPPTFSPYVQEFLSKGIMYFCGRDCKFRPIIIFNAWMLDPKSLNIDSVIDALTYLFEFIMNEIMLPGQVESWVFILDLNKKGVFSLPTTPLKKMIGFLQSNYRGHLWVMHVVNSPSSIMVPWSVMKGFMDETTVKKIQFSKNNVPKTLFEIANPDQIEKKYGGNAQNLVTFWPPVIPTNNYLLPTQDPASCLISPKEYYGRYQAGGLAGLRVNQDLIKQYEESLKAQNKDQKEQVITTKVEDIINKKNAQDQNELKIILKEEEATKSGNSHDLQDQTQCDFPLDLIEELTPPLKIQPVRNAQLATAMERNLIIKLSNRRHGNY